VRTSGHGDYAPERLVTWADASAPANETRQTNEQSPKSRREGTEPPPRK